MNWHRIEGNWKQFRGTVEQEWGKLTDDQLDAIAGKRDADYALPKEKCDAFASDAKSNCLNDAKSRFGKS
jgi:uncharacterized protein YjbJ (UPF0337 family)